MPKYSSGIKRGGNKKAAEPTVHGVPQSKIDKLRGTREQMKPGEQTWEVVKEDYARVGIQVTDEYAKGVWSAVNNYTGSGYFDMRKAYALERGGRLHDLDAHDKDLLAQYKLCMEYCKIAPTVKLPSGYEVSRGIPENGSTYTQGLLALKVGQKWDVDGMPTSFTTKPSVSHNWAGHGGIVIHAPASALKNTPAIRGMSAFSNEYEAFLADYNWKIGNISDQRKEGDGRYHIYLEPAS